MTTELGMYELTHTLCINCCREQSWKRSWYDIQYDKNINSMLPICCDHPIRHLITGYEDGFFCKKEMFVAAMKRQKLKSDRWKKGSEINKDMRWRIMDDLQYMGFIDHNYGDFKFDLNIKYRWKDRTIVIDYPM